MDGRPKRKRPFFMCFLLILLAVSLFLTIFVYRHTDDMFDMPGAVALQRAQQQAPGKGWKPQLPPVMTSGSGGPSWHGEAAVTKQQEGLAEITITPFDNMGKTAQLSSFQVYISAPNGKDEEEITSLFTQGKDGNLKGEIKDRKAGSWQLRIRLHRALSTFEFTERVELK